MPVPDVEVADLGTFWSGDATDMSGGDGPGAATANGDGEGEGGGARCGGADFRVKGPVRGVGGGFEGGVGG